MHTYCLLCTYLRGTNGLVVSIVTIWYIQAVHLQFGKLHADTETFSTQTDVYDPDNGHSCW